MLLLDWWYAGGVRRLHTTNKKFGNNYFVRPPHQSVILLTEEILYCLDCSMASQEDESYGLHSPKAIRKWETGVLQAANAACNTPKTPFLRKPSRLQKQSFFSGCNYFTG